MIGNADEDIDLSLINGSKTPVALSTAENGSSVLLLTEALDREGRLGPAGVAVSLLCTPRNSTQPGYTIPISIRSLSESFPVSLVVGQDYLIRATLTHDCAHPLLVDSFDTPLVGGGRVIDPFRCLLMNIE